MSKYLIEVEHEPNEQACINAIQTFLSTGSHFLTNAEWGCHDDEHKCWMIVEVDDRADAKTILPPLYRKDARIIKLKKYSVNDLKSAKDNKQY